MTDTLLPDKMFHLLPAIYDKVGFADYSRQAIENYLNFLFQHDWAGRHVLELGCGTGAATEYLCEHRMNVKALDVSEEMLAVARQRLQGKNYSVDFIHKDILAYKGGDKQFDLVISIDTLSYIPSVRRLGAVFQQVNEHLKDGKLFMFDLWTIRGMATLLGDKDEVLYDDGGIFVTRRNEFSYDAYRLHQYYTFFQKKDDGEWVRGDEEHIQRGYPFNAVNSMLSRAGFEVRHVLTPWMEPYDIDNDDVGRMIIVAEKEEESD